MKYFCENLTVLGRCLKTPTIFIQDKINKKCAGFCESCFGNLFEDEEYVSEQKFLKYKMTQILK